MFKIKVHTPIVELDGDEMAKVMWKWIKDTLILPYLDLNIEYYDLSITSRNETDDVVTREAAVAIQKYGVGIKCATITPTEAQAKEYKLHRLYPSPNGTIRNIIRGVIFREPILCNNIPRYINNWHLPIIIARHAFGDQYAATELEIEENSTVKFIIEQNGVVKKTVNIATFNTSGVLMATYNYNNSITDFAHACFKYALDENYPLFFSSKNTILKKYDTKFVKIFENVYLSTYKDQFIKQGLYYESRLIDDMVAYAIKSAGGFIWACKNYDGDVQSDMVAQGFGSLGLMSSILLNAEGTVIESEAAHGTIPRHYKEYLKGHKTSTNPIASIFAWTKGLKYRAKFDKNIPLLNFSMSLEKACKAAVAGGYFTKDLAQLLNSSKYLDTQDFLTQVKIFLEYS